MDKPLLALDMIVRNDSRSLQRAIESARPFVDEIVIGIDGRTEEPETRKIAEKYADTVWAFDYKDIGLTEVQWKANLIHFANARNIGRAKVRAPWTLFLDSDEFLECEIDLRAVLSRYLFTSVQAFAPVVHFGNFIFRDPQHLARTHLRWRSPTHNQLPAIVHATDLDARVIRDLSLRREVDNQRRDKQRLEGIELLRPLAEQGDVAALFHLAKHEVYQGDLEVGVKYNERYRAVTASNPRRADDRATLAIATANKYQVQSKPLEADRWALRALQDGPHIQAFEVLAETAAARGDAQAVKVWEKMAAVTPERQRMRIG